MKRTLLVILSMMMLAAGLTACSAGEVEAQPPESASPSMPTLEVPPPASFVPTRPDKPVQKPETFQITEYIPVGGMVEAPEPVERPWRSEQPFEPEDLADYFVVDPVKKQIGGELEVEHLYICSELFPRTQTSYIQGGVFLLGADPVMYRRGSHYDAYAVKDGAVEQLEEHSFVGDCTVLGQEIHLEFDWAEHNGEYIFSYFPAEPNHGWEQYLPDGSVLMRLELGGHGPYLYESYPALLDLKTGELTDLLTGTEGEGLSRYRAGTLAGDRSGMLLCEHRADGYEIGQVYYLDLTDGKLYSLEELSGETVEGCVLLEDRLICWVLEETGKHKVWTIDLNTMERGETISEGWYLHGLRSDTESGDRVDGSRFSLRVNDQKDVVAVDFDSGEHWLVPGLDWSAIPEDRMLLSPDGSKMLFYRNGDRERSVMEYLAVLDMERHVFFEFDRENEYGSGESVRWMTADSFAVVGGLEDGSESYYHIYSLTG